MKVQSGFLRAAVGALLIVGALLVALPTRYRERRYLLNASGCQLQTTIIEPRDERPTGTVILLHGLAANREIMNYFARGFAGQGLRVFVPDLPGHGRTPGPFSVPRAEECAEALAGEIFARGLATPQSTVLAGHSMGGAIALQVAAKVPVAGVIAISPAPMNGAPGIPAQAQIFGNKPATVNNALVISGGLEPRTIRENARDLTRTSTNSKYQVIPWASHVSLLVDPRAVRSAQEWATRNLQLPMRDVLPSLRQTWAFLAGFAGILLLAGPFLRETLGKNPEADEALTTSAGFGRAIVEVGIGAAAAVLLLRWWNPVRGIRLFEGDYLAGFFLITGIVLLGLRFKELRGVASTRWQTVAGAAFAGLALFLLASGWIELTYSEAWLTAARWWRCAVFFAAALPYHWGEELLLGPASQPSWWQRLGKALALRGILWGVLIGAIFVLRSGEILMGLMAPYFLLVFLLQRRGMDIVRKGTGSAPAAAVFGAILLAGFCLVIFPIT